MSASKIGVVILLTAIFSFILLNNQSQNQITFDQFKFNYNLHFDSLFEQKYREKIFAENLNKIQTHNAQSNDYKMGVNQFTHLTQ